MAKDDKTQQDQVQPSNPVEAHILNTTPDPLQEKVSAGEMAPEQADEKVKAATPEDVKVTKADHRVVSSVGLAPGGQGHRLLEPGEIIRHEEFGVDDDERKATIARLIGLGAIEPVDGKDKK